MKKAFWLAIAFGFAWWLLPLKSNSLLYAQITSQNRSQIGAQRAINDKELRAFARAYVQFHKIHAEYEPKLNNANSPQEETQVKQEAIAKIGAVLDREGLTMQRYADLYQTIDADQDLRARAVKLIEEERAKSEAHGDAQFTIGKTSLPARHGPAVRHLAPALT
jgi:hypothetical protein